MDNNQTHKSNNVGWFEQTPDSWSVGKLYQYCRLTNGSTPSRKIDEYWENGTIPWMSSGEVNKKLIEHIDVKISESGFKNSSLEILPVGTVMMGLNGQGKTKGTVGLLRVESTCNQSLCGMIPYKNLSSEFLYFYLESQYRDLRGLVGESQREGISVSFLSRYPVPIPPLEEQQLITRYLDKKTKQIDSLIEKIQKKIELLKEQRTSLINQCVTKGFDPNVEMKDSGVEWIGEIPKHWKRSKLKYLCEIHGRIGYRGYTVNDIVSEGEGCITLGPGNIIDQRLSLEKLTYLSWEKYEESPEIQIFDDDVIFVKTGSTIGKTCIVKNTHYKMTLNPQMIVMKNIKMNPEYFYLQSTCNFFQLSFWVEQTGSSTPTISQEKIYEFPMIVPPVEEQGLIVNHLGSIISRNQNLMDLNIQKINKLKEYRQSLISSAVTGKVRVMEDMI